MKDKARNGAQKGNKKTDAVSLWTAIYLTGMLVVFPLCFHDSYFDLLESKTVIFYGLTGVYLAGYLILKVYNRMRNKAGEKPAVYVKKITLWFGMLLLAALVVSTLLSEDKANAVLGTEGRLFGAMLLFSCLLLYLCIADSGLKHDVWIWCGAPGISLVSALTIGSRYGFDPLHMYAELDESQIGDYLGTMGQKTITACFLGIFLLLFTGTFLYADLLWKKCLSGTAVILIFCAGICTNSDTFLAAAVISGIFYLWFVMKNAEMLTRYIFFIVETASGMLFLKVFNELTGWRADWEESHYMLIDEVPWLAILAAAVILCAVLKKILRKKESENYLLRLRKIIFVFLAVSAAIVCLWAAYLNFAAADPENSFGAKYLYFCDAWGTNRGYVWTRAFALYKKLPLFNKLVGIGPGKFGQFFSEYYIDSVMQFGYYFEDAHSEFFQFLVTLGVAGMIGYYGMLVSCIIRCLKSGQSRKIVMAGALTAAFFVGLVNNPLVFTTPFVFMIMGVGDAES